MIVLIEVLRAVITRSKKYNPGALKYDPTRNTVHLHREGHEVEVRVRSLDDLIIETTEEHTGWSGSSQN